MTRPEPPEGIRLRLATGDHALPLAVSYTGTDKHGIHVWTATFPDLSDAIGIHVDLIPPRTTIKIQEGTPQ